MRGRKSNSTRQSGTPQSLASHTSGTPPVMKRKRSSKTLIDWNTVEQRKNFKNGFWIQPLKASEVAEPLNKRRKLNEPVDYVLNEAEEEINKTQNSPFENSTLGDFHYRVEPSDLWLGAQRYRKFTIQEENFCVNDCVYIKAAAADDPDPDAAIAGWVGKVLEVRAGNEAHVYLRIYWMYRPEDLPGGRQPYHGKNELIASNDMHVIDAQTVEGKANVVQWVEDIDKDEQLNPAQLIWRQTYDVTKSEKARLSKLTKHCIDNKPCNPDELLIQCDHCKKWLHGSCLEDDAVRKAYQTHQITYPGEQTTQNTPNSSKRRSSGKVDESTPRKPGRPRKSESRKSLVQESVFSASLSVSGQAKITVTDKRPGQESESWDSPVICLLCGELVDQEEQIEEKEEEEEEKEEKEEKISNSSGVFVSGPFVSGPNGNAAVDEMETSAEPESAPELKIEGQDSLMRKVLKDVGPVTPPNKEEESEVEDTTVSSPNVASAPSPQILDSAQAVVSAGAHKLAELFQMRAS